MRLSRVSGFSLIELLMVIVVISILAGLLLPAISGARRKTLETTCRSNLKQITVALEAYSNDNGGRIPDTGGSYWGSSIPVVRMYGGLVYALGHLIVDYRVTPEVFGCPASNERSPEYVRAAWNSGAVTQTAYLYRETDAGFNSVKSSPKNAGRALVTDFACVYATSEIVPHAYKNVNILYNDSHVATLPNSPTPGEAYTMEALSGGHTVPPCSFIWEHADAAGK